MDLGCLWIKSRNFVTIVWSCEKWQAISWPAGWFHPPMSFRVKRILIWISCDFCWCKDCSRVFQLWIINYYVKNLSNNLSNENINNSVSVVFKTQWELKCKNELFSTNHFSENTSVYVFLTKIIWRTFDVIIDNL